MSCPTCGATLYAKTERRALFPRVLADRAVTSLGREFSNLHTPCTLKPGEGQPVKVTLA